MRKTAKCFWLYAGSMVLAGVAFFLLERFDAGKAWSLTLYLCPGLGGTGGLADIQRERPASSSGLFCADRFLYGLPIGLTLCIVIPLMV